MTPTEWIAARRAMLEKKTPGPWHQQSDGWTVRGPDPDADTRGVRVATTNKSGDSVEREVSNASLIVAAVNEQEAVVRLVEAVSSYLYGAQPGRLGEMERALAALVGDSHE